MCAQARFHPDEASWKDAWVHNSMAMVALLSESCRSVILYCAKNHLRNVATCWTKSSHCCVRTEFVESQQNASSKMYCMTAQKSKNHAFHQSVEARSRTAACIKIMYLSWQEQDDCNASFESSIGYYMTTLHGSKILESLWIFRVHSVVVRV